MVGKHPKLDDLADGDLKFHTDFRSVYASLLDGWLGVDSRAVLGDKFPELKLVDPSKKVEVPKGVSPAGSVAPAPGPTTKSAAPPPAPAPEPVPVKE